MVAIKALYGPRGERPANEEDVAQMLLKFAARLEARPVEAADPPAGPMPGPGRLIPRRYAVSNAVIVGC